MVRVSLVLAVLLFPLSAASATVALLPPVPVAHARAPAGADLYATILAAHDIARVRSLPRPPSPDAGHLLAVALAGVLSLLFAQAAPSPRRSSSRRRG